MRHLDTGHVTQMTSNDQGGRDPAGTSQPRRRDRDQDSPADTATPPAS